MQSCPAFAELIQGLQSIAPGLHGKCQESWGSLNPSARRLIRDSLAQSLHSLIASDSAALADLEQPPRLHEWSVSISHTQNLGGWMALKRPLQIGWDAEIQSRIKTTIIDRVSDPIEREEVPQLALLWPAKESYFKALEDEQPLAITQLSITSWRTIRPGLWAWQGLGPRNGDGVVLESGDWLMAACVIT